jgi:cytochrome P450
VHRAVPEPASAHHSAALAFSVRWRDHLRTRWHETTLYAASHPLALAGVELLRFTGPATRVPGLGVLVSDPRVAREILDDDQHFSKAAPGSAGAVQAQVLGEYALLNLDGEAHRSLRRQVGDLFTARYLEEVTTDVLHQPIGAVVDRLQAGVAVDLVPFVHRLTGRMICHQIGILPEAGAEDATYLNMFRRGQSLAAMMRLSTVHLGPRQAALAREIWSDFEQRVAEAYRSGSQPSSVVYKLRNLRLSLAVVTGVAGALFLTGTQSVSAALPRIIALLVDTRQWRTLRDHRELLNQAIDEGLRVTVPSPVMLRSTIVPTEINGIRFRRGDRAVVLTYNLAKNRRLYPQPRRFDILRRHPPEGRNLWFGVGARFCLGYGLAQRELSAVLDALLSLDGTLRIARRRAARRVLLPAYETLEVRLVSDGMP